MSVRLTNGWMSNKGTSKVPCSMKQTDILSQIIGCLVMDPDGEVYMVTGSKRIHEMFEPYIKLYRLSDKKEVYVSLSAYAVMCDIAEECFLPVR